MALFRPTAGLLMTTARALPVISGRFYHEKVIFRKSMASPVGSRRQYLKKSRFSLLSKVIDHYEKPRNVGKLDHKKKNVGTGLVGAPACGAVMKLQVGTS